jgi:hypothetical protein
MVFLMGSDVKTTRVAGGGRRSSINPAIGVPPSQANMVVRQIVDRIREIVETFIARAPLEKPSYNGDDECLMGIHDCQDTQGMKFFV